MKPGTDHEKQMQVSRLKRWIDKEEFIEAGSQLNVTGIGGDARPGSMVAVKQQRMGDGTWLMSGLRVLFIYRPRRIADVRREMVMTRSDYRKFAADSRIVDVQ